MASKSLDVRLPDSMIDAVSTLHLPETAHAILRREGAGLPLTTRGLKAILDRLSVEAAIYETAQRLDAVKGEVATVDDARKVLDRLSKDNDSLQKEVADLRARLTAATAEPAMAVSGAGTGR